MEENKNISAGAQKSELLSLKTRENNTQKMILHRNARYGKSFLNQRYAWPGTLHWAMSFIKYCQHNLSARTKNILQLTNFPTHTWI
jgi:hypothetical protein